MNIKERPLVTIGIPTYNRAGSYLQGTLESALNQSYKNIEIVVSDNCSPDGTETLVKSYSDARLKYFRQSENIKPNDNFNFCLSKAEGAYFLLLHDDDLIDFDFIETCLNAAKYNTNVGIIRTGTRIVDGNNKMKGESLNLVEGLSLEDFFLGWFSGKTRLYLCSTLFNTKELKKIGGFKSKHNLFQDVIAEVELAAQHGRVDVKEVKASFRKHPGEMTHASSIYGWCEDSLILLDKICKLSQIKAHHIRKKGKRFFCFINYNRASGVKSFSDRMVAYLTVFRIFGYSYTPFHFFLRKHVISFLRKIKRKIISYQKFNSYERKNSR